MDLKEELLPHAWIRRRLLLFIKSIQGCVAVEVKIESLGRKLIARQYRGIVGVIVKAVLKLGDVKPARHSSCGRRSLPLI